MSLEESFYERAVQSLRNPNEVTRELSDLALNEASIELWDRAVANHQLLDVAMVRLKINLKIEVSEQDWLLYKEAKKSAAKIDNEAQLQTLVEIGTKESAWDM
jgi:hypothetical protein